MIQHVVVFTVSSENQAKLESILAEFANGIAGCDGLRELEWGTNINASGLALGYSHACIVTLESVEVLNDIYWNHPAHVQLGTSLDEIEVQRFALDFSAESKST